MQDTQRMEQYLASIDRLTQRLVVLQEEHRKDGKGNTTNSSNTSVKASDTNTQRQREEEEQRARAAEQENLRIQRNTNNTQENLNRQRLITFELLNKALDGSRQLNADTRQFISNFVSIGMDLVNDLTSFESSSKQALAASKGLLSSGQLIKVVANEFSNTARNIAQFGIAAGGIMSAVSVVSAYLRREQEKIEHSVRVAISKSENKREVEQILASTDQGRTSLDLEFARHNSEVNEIEEKRRKYDELYKKYEQQKIDAANKAQENYGFGPAYADASLSVSKSKDLRELEAFLDKKDSEALERTNKGEELEAKIRAQKEQADNIAALDAVQAQLEQDLYDVRVKSYSQSFVSLKGAYKRAQQDLEAKLNGKTDSTALSSVIDMQSAALQQSIAAIKQQYETDAAELRTRPPTDIAGNTIQSALQEAEKSLLKGFQDKVRAEVFDMAEINKDADGQWLYGTKPVKLTDADGNNLRKKQTEAKAQISKVIAEAQSSFDSQGLTTEDNRVKDEIAAINLRLRDTVQGITRAAATTLKRVSGEFIDPTSAVEIKEKELNDTIAAYEAEKKTASKGAQGPLDAELYKANETLKTLIEVDKVVAARQKVDEESKLRIEQIEHNMAVMQASDAVQAAGNVGANANRRRQMQASYGKIGGAYATYLDQAEQRRQFAQAQFIRNRRISEAEAELEFIGEDKATEGRRAELQKQITSLKRESEKAEIEQKRALTEQLYNLQYQLNDDKPTLRRMRSVTKLGDREPIEENSGYGRSTRLGPSALFDKGRAARREVDFGVGLGSESARLTSDFNEKWRREHGKLTPEEQAAAKEERKLNNQLERARRAIANGGGTSKQRELVKNYEAAKDPKADPVERIAKAMPAILSQLSHMSGKKVEVAE